MFSTATSFGVITIVTSLHAIIAIISFLLAKQNDTIVVRRIFKLIYSLLIGWLLSFASVSSFMFMRSEMAMQVYVFDLGMLSTIFVFTLFQGFLYGFIDDWLEKRKNNT
ncbi:hypothetical protein [Texcoconibacillus texcoconensis]|uniref:Uncharacterized protein n=1 Tax=Texcoconibacillus texcoconensis TaxID=1095777 RepID=A0A840QPN8_9BACI|nr:hypothetical protein [Texcoconibacillus texcoconensis]MBB5173308.1 hypothetical protein [Texcoconibacillus texcoconensis]